MTLDLSSQFISFGTLPFQWNFFSMQLMLCLWWSWFFFFKRNRHTLKIRFASSLQSTVELQVCLYLKIIDINIFQKEWYKSWNAIFPIPTTWNKSDEKWKKILFKWWQHFVSNFLLSRNHKFNLISNPIEYYEEFWFWFSSKRNSNFHKVQRRASFLAYKLIQLSEIVWLP